MENVEFRCELIFVLMPIYYDVLVTQNGILPWLSATVLRLAPFCTCSRSVRALPAPIARLLAQGPGQIGYPGVN